MTCPSLTWINAAARYFNAVCATLGELLDGFPPQECANYFANSGYDEPKSITL
jgi:hypothetical protein